MKSDHKMTAAAAPEGEGTGKRESKRHNKIIYVVRNAERGQLRQSGKGEERGGMPMRESERGPIYAGRKQTLRLGR